MYVGGKSVVIVAPRARMPLVRAKVRCANAMRGTEINDQVGSSCIRYFNCGWPGANQHGAGTR